MKSYLVFLSRHKLYTAIQALGLIISIAFIILIGNYVWGQYRIAYSNKYSDRVFAVGYDKGASLSVGDKDELEEKLAGLEAVTRVAGGDNIVLGINGEREVFPYLEIDKQFFEIFPEFELIEGKKDDLIPNSFVISEKFAQTYFPNENPIGKKFAGDDWVVKGVYRVNGPTILEETDVVQLINFRKDSKDYSPFSSIGNYITFIKMPPKTDIEVLEENVRKILRPHYSSKWIKDFKLYSLPYLYFNDIDWQLKKGDKSLLLALVGVIFLLLLSSMINYINLTLALSGQRAKEMAIRRLHGTSRNNVMLKNISESVLFVFICSLLGVGLAYIFKNPVDLMLRYIAMDSFTDAWRITPLTIIWNVASIFIFIGFILVLGIIAGTMPALYTSRFNPIDIVRGTLKVKNRMVFGKIFIVFQNIIAVMLISFSMVMESQLNHMRNMPLNANLKNIYYLQVVFADYSEAVPFIDRLSQIPGVKNIGYGTGYPGKIGMYSDFSEKGKEGLQGGLMRGDRNFFDIMGLNIISGTDDPKGSEMLYISESLASSLGITDAESAAPYLGYIRINGTQVSSFGGVYQDVPNQASDISEFNFKTIFILAEGEKMPYSNVILVEVNEESDEMETKIMDAYKDSSKELHGAYLEPWENGFLSVLKEKSLAHIKSTVILLEIFMAISIILSLLGLIAMSTYYANENTKGIAIRKVLGSDVKGETWRNIRLYMILVLIAIAIAVPLSIVISREYLARFAYRIDNYWWIFIVASVGSLLVAFLSVYWQISRSAHVNPASELKKE